MRIPERHRFGYVSLHRDLIHSHQFPQRSLRTHLHEHVLKVKAYDRQLLTKFPPLTEEELNEYDENVPGCIVITAANFRIDPSRELDIGFNQEAVHVAAADFLKRVKVDKWYQPDRFPPDLLCLDELVPIVRQHFKYIWRVCKQQVAVVERGEVVEISRLSKEAKRSRKSKVRLPIYGRVLPNADVSIACIIAAQCGVRRSTTGEAPRAHGYAQRTVRQQ